MSTYYLYESIKSLLKKYLGKYTVVCFRVRFQESIAMGEIIKILYTILLSL